MSNRQQSRTDTRRVRNQLVIPATASSAVPDVVARKDQAAATLMRGLAQFSSALLQYLPGQSEAPADDSDQSNYVAQTASMQNERDRLIAMQPSHQAKMREDFLDAAAAMNPLVLNSEAWIAQGARRVGAQEAGVSPGIRYSGSPWSRYENGREMEDTTTVRLGAQ